MFKLFLLLYADDIVIFAETETILNYGCEIWGLKETNVIERIHLQYCKQLLGVRAQTQNNFVYG
jgi:hypothetical protein